MRGGSECLFLAFRDCAVIARWLRMPFLAFWRLRGDCAVAQNAYSGPLEIARSLRGGLECLFLPFGDACFFGGEVIFDFESLLVRETLREICFDVMTSSFFEFSASSRGIESGRLS